MSSLFIAIVIKPSNIRIWIHDKDIGKLTQVLWEGQGNRLRTEVCSNNRVKKFLDAVPYVMVWRNWNYFLFSHPIEFFQFDKSKPFIDRCIECDKRNARSCSWKQFEWAN